jgi:hypothetical protein
METDNNIPRDSGQSECIARHFGAVFVGQDRDIEQRAINVVVLRITN